MIDVEASQRFLPVYFSFLLPFLSGSYKNVLNISRQHNENKVTYIKGGTIIPALAEESAAVVGCSGGLVVVTAAAGGGTGFPVMADHLAVSFK